MGDEDRRRPDGGYVTRGELRAVEARWSDRWKRLDEALSFYDSMCELGLRELLPLILKDAAARQVLNVLREDRYRWAVRLGAYLFILSLAVGAIGGSLAIARTLHLLR